MPTDPPPTDSLKKQARNFNDGRLIKIRPHSATLADAVRRFDGFTWPELVALELMKQEGSGRP